MAQVKTYHTVNAEKENSSFSISRMEAIYEKRKGAMDEPHRHNFYTILVIKQAHGNHKIDFNSYDLASNQVFFVAPGQVHQVMESEKSKGFAMTFSTQFLIENSIPLSFIESLNLFQNYGQSPPLLPNQEQFDRIELFANEIFSLFESNRHLKHFSMGSFLKLMLIECNNLCSTNPIEEKVDLSGDSIIRKFKQLVNERYKTEHSTSFYANELHISPDHLNRVIKTSIGKTAKEYIQTRIVTEAKRLLYFTDLSNKEIGYELGFSEPANFSAFFKKCTQISPSGFKKMEIES